MCATQPVAEVRKKVEALTVCAGFLGAGFKNIDVEGADGRGHFGLKSGDCMFAPGS